MARSSPAAQVLALHPGEMLEPADASDASPDDAALDAADADAGVVTVDSAQGQVGPAADDGQLAAWIERIASQDERALEALYDATAARLHASVRRLTRNEALAEEVVEDCFWQVWRQAPRFDPARGKAITWMLAIARSRAIDGLRRDRRFAHEELPEDDLAEDPADDTPETQFEAGRDAQALNAALARLGARERQLVSMAFLRGLTHEEIAAQMAMPLGTVKSLVRRSLIALRHHLEAAHAGR